MSRSSGQDVYGVIVIGTGPIGQTVADRACAAGLSIAAVERELVGVSARTGRASPARRCCGRSCRSPDDQGQADSLTSLGAELIRGRGRLNGPRRVAVETPGGRRVPLTARHAVAICTGSRPALSDLPGLREARPWTNREATDSHTVPGRLAIVGGGGVGGEMASAWSGLGASGTLFAQADGLLPRMEPFAGEMAGRTLAEAGADVRISSTVTAVHRRGGTGPLTLTLEDADELQADQVLFATARLPPTDDIGLETVGLAPGSWLEVVDTCRIRALEDDWLYALGDVNHHALLTHQGKYQARIAGAAIAARAAGKALDTAPWGANAVTARLPGRATGVLPRPLGRGGRPHSRPSRTRRPSPPSAGPPPGVRATLRLRRGGENSPLTSFEGPLRVLWGGRSRAGAFGPVQEDHQMGAEKVFSDPGFFPR